MSILCLCKKNPQYQLLAIEYHFNQEKIINFAKREYSSAKNTLNA